ncbi:MAG: hypothetical protein RR522_00635 [Alistipes sp.]
MNENKLYQAPELNVWSIAAEQGFAASIPDADGNFPGFGDNDTIIWG